MGRIDKVSNKISQILGTRTFYHDTKAFQEKIDSDHLMEIEELKKKFPEKTRK